MVLDQLKNEKFVNLHIVLGLVNDKKLGSILSLFPKTASYYFCRPDIPRGLDAALLQTNALKYALRGDSYASVDIAFKMAKSMANKEDLIYVGGSTFVVAELAL